MFNLFNFKYKLRNKWRTSYRSLRKEINKSYKTHKRDYKTNKSVSSFANMFY